MTKHPDFFSLLVIAAHNCHNKTKICHKLKHVYYLLFSNI